MARGRRKPDAVMRVIARKIEEWGVGRVFTIAELRRFVFDATGVDFIQLDRRLRDLRSYRWVIDSYRNDKSLKPNEYKIIKIGDDVNHPACAPQARGCPPALRRKLFARDGQQCRNCGIKQGEEYPEYLGRYARMTVARGLPGSRGGPYTLANARIECDACNEMVRDTYYEGPGKAA
jgi:hypothetical protein